MRDASAPEIPVIEGCMETLGRCLRVAESLDDAAYTAKAGRHDSIGAHMRHCLDYFSCFFNGITDGSVDYDARERNEDLASRRELAIEELNRLMRILVDLGSDDLSREVEPRESVSSRHPGAALKSTVERELVYLSQHTIHHLAIMTMLAELNGHEIDEAIGTAYSTRIFRESQASAFGPKGE